MSTIPSPDSSDYMQEAARQDTFLRDRLAAIRGQYDVGDITELEACYLRCAALEHHIQTSRNLRHEHFGDGR